LDYKQLNIDKSVKTSIKMLDYNSQDPTFDALFNIYSLPYQISRSSRYSPFATPNTDILESNDAYKAVFVLPGVAMENIYIDFEENSLIVATRESELLHGRVDSDVSEEIKLQSDHENGNETGANSKEFKTILKQITSKPYKKMIEFPIQIDYESVSADYFDGILTVILPKSTKTQ
jgi:HSP20 family protein